MARAGTPLEILQSQGLEFTLHVVLRVSREICQRAKDALVVIVFLRAGLSDLVGVRDVLVQLLTSRSMPSEYSAKEPCQGLLSSYIIAPSRTQ